jgi:hypothetical protein
MKKILIFGAFLGFFACAPALCAVRDGATTSSRAKQSRTATTVVRTNTTGEVARTVAPTRTNVSLSRAGTLRSGIQPRTLGAATAAAARNRKAASATRSAYVPASTRVAQRSRAATGQISGITETRTGAAYNQCKTAYFQCMDQFCTLKNDDYRRCSCSSRIYDLMAARENLTETSAKLTEFTENLDIVGMTAAQATAVHTASDGENALTADTSASKALLTAIMNSIRGEDATVSGKMSSLNSINLSFDTGIGFGMSDNAQVIASYNGTELYNAVYSACRTVVKDDCNDAALQRAVTAYLMAIEQDCNTVQSALGKKQKELKAAIREGGAMLDLARVENRQKHNSDDKAACIANVETAVLSEQVCGAGYHKCLDDGKFIDITTGAPIAGVVDFYELANMLRFDTGKNAVDQKLAQNPDNRMFVRNFEEKTKKFAKDALDKCQEIADDVWQDYLDRALLDIYYAQRAKVDTIKTGCFDLISSCYQDREASITAAMASLIDGRSEILLQPDKIVLTSQMCSDYIASCNNMFGNDVINEYIANQTKTDTLAACRAIADQCFTNFGGTNYENFYYPSSGLFTPNMADALVQSGDDATFNSALDWFALYEYDENGERKDGYKSECAKQLAQMPNCVDKIEQVFGGLDAVIARQKKDFEGAYEYVKPTTDKAHAYGWARRDNEGYIDWDDSTYEFKNRRLRPTGVATEVYNRIIDTLTTQCLNVDGKFVEAQVIDHDRYGGVTNYNGLAVYNNACKLIAQTSNNFAGYGITTSYAEDMCPQDYSLRVDIDVWGACLCWENGGRRSKNGQSAKCVPMVPVVYDNSAVDACDDAHDVSCQEIGREGLCTILDASYYVGHNSIPVSAWCTPEMSSDSDQVCPYGAGCDIPDGVPLGNRAQVVP